VTHGRIAQKISQNLRLGKREAGLLEIGSLNPDSWADFPHHRGKTFEIISNILDARGLFLDDDECYSSLGVALHYIQDRWTLRPRLKDKHTKWEVQINMGEILEDYQSLENVTKQTLLPTKAEKAYISFLSKIREGIIGVEEEWTDVRCPSLCFSGFCGRTIAFALQDRPTTWSSPILDLNFAYLICYELSSAVLSHIKEDTEANYWENVEFIRSKCSDISNLSWSEMWELRHLDLY